MITLYPRLWRLPQKQDSQRLTVQSNIECISAHAGNITEISAVIIATRDDTFWALQLFAMKQNIAAMLCK